MSNIFKSDVKIKSSSIIGASFVALFIITLLMYIYLSSNTDIEIWTAILASLSAGLFVAIIQFFLSFSTFKANEKILSLGVKKILITRDDRMFYQDYINGAEEAIDMMGTTGSRFLTDFADQETGASEGAKSILYKLEKGIKIRILMPKKIHLIKSDDKANSDIAFKKMKAISEKHSNFEFRYFNHIPTHGIFRVDNDNIVGPIFAHSSSKNTPAIQLKNNSPYAKKYQENFEFEWENSDTKS